jgi:tetratricopeptide (TPR) repeat protein
VSSLPRLLAGATLLLLVGCDALVGADKRIQQGRAALAAADYNVAALRFKSAVLKAPDSVDARLGLAESELGLGDPASAQKEVSRAEALKGAPERVEPLKWRALLALRQFAAVESGLAAPRAGLAETERMLLRAEALAHLGRGAEAAALYQALVAAPAAPLEAYTGYGVLLANSGQVAAAQKEFDAALTRKPNDVGTLVLKATALERAGKLAEAGAAFAVARQHADARQNLSLYVQALAGVADIGLALGHPDEARSALADLTANAPNVVATRMLAARVALLDGKPSAALDTLQGVVAAQPDNLQAEYLRGLAEAATNQLAQAETSFAQILRAEPANSGVRKLLADVQLRQGRTDAAHATLDADPDGDASAGIRARLARQMAGEGDASGAAKVADQLEGRQGTRFDGLVLRGDLAAREGRFADAVAAYTEALAIRRTGAVLLRRFEARGRANQPTDPAELGAWLKDHPKDHEVRFAYAAALDAGGDPRGAIREYEAILAAVPTAVAPLNNVALLYDRMYDPRALATARRAYALGREVPAVVDTLAWILMRHGGANEAVTLLAPVASASVDPDVRFHYAFGLAKVGRKDEASRILNDILSKTPQFESRSAAEALAKDLT